MGKVKCFYHSSDMDGKCSGAIVRQYYGPETEMIGIDYRDEFPFNDIQPYDKVVIVDFSLQKEGDFERLLAITDDVIWIDHHKSAIEKHAKISDRIEGVRMDGVAACKLTWAYFYPIYLIPTVVELLADYDVWAFKYGEQTNQMQTGIRLYDTRVESDMWKIWLDPSYDPDKELDDGFIALQYRNNFAADLIKAYSFFAQFEGYRAVCCNAGSFSSQLFDSVTEEYDIMICFIFDGRQWKVSVYTKKDDIDCSEIAKKYGGGGHRQAAGFQCKELPFGRMD
jgi:oligoribonuclease NrnB/cAMP/cGMP phosphodiesterase (DHH superfamily)